MGAGVKNASDFLTVTKSSIPGLEGIKTDAGKGLGIWITAGVFPGTRQRDTKEVVASEKAFLLLKEQSLTLQR